jgi:hypothetical protein
VDESPSKILKINKNPFANTYCAPRLSHTRTSSAHTNFQKFNMGCGYSRGSWQGWKEPEPHDILLKFFLWSLLFFVGMVSYRHFFPLPQKKKKVNKKERIKNPKE